MPTLRSKRWSWSSVFLMNHNVFAFGLVTAELGSSVSIPCDSSVSDHDNTTGVAAFEAQWLDPKGRSLDSGTEPKVDPFTGNLMLSGVLFTDSGQYRCQVRYADGEALQLRTFEHVLQVYQTSVQGTCDCGCELVDNLCLACGPGQYGLEGRCYFCDVAQFNDAYASMCCHDCPVFYITWGRGATSKDQCSSALRDYCLGLGLVGSLALSLHGFYKFCGPILLDAVHEYLEASDEEPAPSEEGDSPDREPGGGVSGVLDGIVKILRKRRGQRATSHSEEEVPLIETRVPGGSDEDSPITTSLDIEGGSDEVTGLSEEDDGGISSPDSVDHKGPWKSRFHTSRPSVSDKTSSSSPDDSSSSNLDPVPSKEPRRRKPNAAHQDVSDDVSSRSEDEDIFRDPELANDDSARSPPGDDVYRSVGDIADFTEGSRKWCEYDVHVTYQRSGSDVRSVSASQSTNSSQETALDVGEQMGHGQRAMDSLNQSPWLQKMLRKYADKE
ncbi:unnamed protein product [Ixodes hexagonus]